MSRKGQAPKRKIAPDPVFQDERIAKFTNILMERGKKELAQDILYKALQLMVDRLPKDVEISKIIEVVEESSDEGEDNSRGRKPVGRSGREGKDRGRDRGRDRDRGGASAFKSGGSSVPFKPVKGDIHTLAEAKETALVAFNFALGQVAPFVEVKTRRVGGSNYQVPVEVAPRRRQALGMRWIISAAKNRGEHTMVARLAAELLDACQNRGGAVKKREDTRKMAEANKAFSHYRW